MHLAVVVAMVAVSVVQVVAHQVIDMVSVRYRWVAAVGAVNMAVAMSRALVGRGAFFGIIRTHLNVMFFDMVAVLVMQVAIVEIIGVTVMHHRRVAAIRAVLMGVGAGMFLMSV